MSDVYSTGRLAQESGVHVETVRYYERLGLLREPGRRPSGYRKYTPADLKRLRSIVRLKQYGFTLKEIRQLMDASNQPDASCGDVQERFRAKLAELRRKIDDLQSQCRTIEQAISVCDPATALCDCPQIELVELDGHCGTA